MPQFEKANEFPDPKVSTLSDEERRARYDQMRLRQSRSAIHVDTPNGITCRWVRKDDPRDIANHKIKGFEYVRDNPKFPPLSEDETPGTPGKRQFRCMMPIQPDGTYVYGDVILMWIPTDEYDFQVNEATRLSKERIEAPKRTFRAQAEAVGVSAFERDRSGNILR